MSLELVVTIVSLLVRQFPSPSSFKIVAKFRPRCTYSKLGHNIWYKGVMVIIIAIMITWVIMLALIHMQQSLVYCHYGLYIYYV